MPSEAVRKILDRLERIRETGTGWMARCKAHDDRTASLSISEGADGRVLLFCHAGCSTQRVLEALNLGNADLFEPTNGNGSGPQILTTYDYKDETGALLYQVVRTHPKGFKQRHPTGAGWEWGTRGIRRVLYRLPELAGQAEIVVAEGEKDVDRLWSVGIPATTNVGGAGKWSSDYAEQLRNAGCHRVIVLPDNDPAGADHAVAVVAACLLGGLEAVSVPLPNLPAKGDVSDYLDHHTVADLRAALAGPPAADGLPGLCSLEALLNEPIEIPRWVVTDRIPEASVCLLVAKPKVGKTTAARHLAVAVARGDDWLGSRCEPGLVWYFAFEGRKADHLSHFRQLDLDPEDSRRIWFYNDTAGPKLLQELAAHAARERPALIIVDTLQRLLRVKSMDDYAEVTSAFEPILACARQTGAALLLIHHAGKNADREALDTVLGSTAIAGSVDNTIVLAKLGTFRTVASRQRVGPDLEERVISLTQAGEVVLGESREQAELRALMKKLYDALANGTEPMQTAGWFDLVEGRRQAKLRAANLLVSEGAIVRTGSGTRHHPYVYTVVGSKAPPPAPAGPVQADIFEP